MKKKKIIVTEEQIDRLLGEGFMAYLDKKEYASEPEGNCYSTEVYTNGKDANDDDMKPQCTDRVSRERYPRNPFSYWNGTRGYALGGVGMVYEDDEILDEDNQELMPRQFSVNSQLKSDIQNSANGGNDRLLNNMAKEDSFNIKTAYKRKHDLELMAKNDPAKFKATGRDKILADITNQIENAKNVSKSSKEAKKNANIANAFQKAGGTKTYGNGKAHTAKNTPTIIPNK